MCRNDIKLKAQVDLDHPCRSTRFTETPSIAPTVAERGPCGTPVHCKVQHRPSYRRSTESRQFGRVDSGLIASSARGRTSSPMSTPLYLGAAWMKLVSSESLIFMITVLLEAWLRRH